MATAIINIGTNLGQRRMNLSRAMAAINRTFGDFEMSHVVESEPWGFDSGNKFLNVCLMFATDLEPEELLDELQRIERELSPAPHRNPDGSYADRLIDIDLIAVDDMVIDTPRLTLPHPHLAERRFFLVPLDEIAPGWRHPVSGLDAAAMLAILPAEPSKPTE